MKATFCFIKLNGDTKSQRPLYLQVSAKSQAPLLYHDISSQRKSSF